MHTIVIKVDDQIISNSDSFTNKDVKNITRDLKKVFKDFKHFVGDYEFYEHCNDIVQEDEGVDTNNPFLVTLHAIVLATVTMELNTLYLIVDGKVSCAIDVSKHRNAQFKDEYKDCIECNIDVPEEPENAFYEPTRIVS